MPETKPTRGGARKGAGRPAKAPTLRCELLLEPHQREAIRNAGNGNESEGARLIIDAHIAQQKSE